MGARLAHGIAAFFSMCRNISADVHELARRQRETDDNLRRQASRVCPLPLARLTCLSIRLPRRSMSGTSRPMGCPLCQQTTKKKKKPTLMIASSLPRLPTKGIRVNHPLTLRPRILLEVLLPRISLGKNTSHLTWRTISSLRISLLLTGDLCVGGSLLFFWFLLPKRGRRFLILAVPSIYVMNIGL
jgi:hypothetical protein